MNNRRLYALASAGLLLVGRLPTARADSLLFSYEGDVFPWEGGYSIFNTCDGDCTSSLGSGNYVASFVQGWGDCYNYSRLIIPSPAPLPDSFFVEARFKSNTAQPSQHTNDGRVSVGYFGIADVVFLHGDAAFSFSGGNTVTDRAVGEFYICRFESLNHYDWSWTVDGQLLLNDSVDFAANYRYVQFGGDGGFIHGIHGLTNWWEFIRFGTIAFGELVESSDPPNGYVDPRQDRPPFQPAALQGITSFEVTFDQPNGLNVDQVTVESTAPPRLRPSVEWVTRPDNEPDGRTVEIRLDKRIPPGHRTRFIISDEAEAEQWGQVGATSVVEYAFLPGDVNQNESVSTADVLTLVAALNNPEAVNPLLHDINRNDVASSTDILRLVQLLNGIGTSQPWLGYSLPPWP